MRSTLGDSTVMSCGCVSFIARQRTSGSCLLTSRAHRVSGVNWAALCTSGMGGTANIVEYGEVEQELQNRRLISDVALGGTSYYGWGGILAGPLTHKRQASGHAR